MLNKVTRRRFNKMTKPNFIPADIYNQLKEELENYKLTLDLLETYVRRTPCDHDITVEQHEAWIKYKMAADNLK